MQQNQMQKFKKCVCTSYFKKQITDQQFLKCNHCQNHFHIICLNLQQPPTSPYECPVCFIQILDPFS